MQVLIAAKFIFLFQNKEIGELHKCGCGNLLYSMHKNGEGNEKCASCHFTYLLWHKKERACRNGTPFCDQDFFVFVTAFFGRLDFLGASCPSTGGWALASFRTKPVRAGM